MMLGACLLSFDRLVFSLSRMTTISKIVKFALCFALFSALFFVAPVELYRLTWPKVNATVTSSHREWHVVTPINGRGHPLANIEYEYDVEGKTYSNADFDDNGAFGRNDPFASEARVEAMMQTYPVGRVIQVRYKPGAPQTAMIRPHRSLKQWGWIGLGSFTLGLLLSQSWFKFANRKKDEEPAKKPS